MAAKIDLPVLIAPLGHQDPQNQVGEQTWQTAWQQQDKEDQAHDDLHLDQLPASKRALVSSLNMAHRV